MKLIVHIGNGKTGTTSIQNGLEVYSAELKTHGIHYLGRMLEHAPVSAPRDWQNPDGAELLLHKMDAEDVRSDLVAVLTDALSALKDQEISTAIWSNEALFARHFGVIDALQAVQSQGVEVEIILYLRRHDGWAKSAYAQWGIRHKSYQGPVKGFSEWIAERPVRFAPNLEVWNAAFGAALDLRNFDEVADVGAEFFEGIGIAGLDHSRVYQTPSIEQLTAHAMFNTQFPGVVYPDRFGALMRVAGLGALDREAAQKLQNLLPGTADLERVLHECADDLARVDAVFSEKGQPVFSKDPRKQSDDSADIWTFVVHLMTAHFTLLDRVAQLEHRLTKLEQR